ncbi:SMP-30/gluconolactonase/LRE family protein [Streptantibioticus ferralitis]
MASMSKPELRPVAWRPPPRPGPAGGDRVPVSAPRLLPLGGTGPEHVVVDTAGRLLTGVADGRILRVDPETGEVTTVADTGGRPLGLQLQPDGRLLVCDARAGLLRVVPETGETEVLLRSAGGEPLGFCSNVVVTRDGTIYVSDASRRFGIDHWLGDLLEHSGTGRLIRIAPGAVEPEVVLDGLYFANGLALPADESFVTVAETGAYRLTRLWLTGPRAGHRDTFLEDLPGFPDNLTTGPGGLIWIAYAAPRDPLMDWLHRTPPVLRRALWKLPESMRPGPRRTLRVTAVDSAGRTAHDLRWPRARYRTATSACEHGGRLYLGSLVEDAIAVLELPER